MPLFSRKKHIEDIHVQPPISSRIEVELNKTANTEAVEKAKKANQHLNDLLVENGFTLKIYLATGGTPKKRRN